MLEFSASQNVSLSMIFMAAYLVAFLFSTSKDMVYAFGASVACQCYGLSPLYNYTIELNPALVFLVYASIYFTAIRFLSTYKVIAACFIMALFEGLMYKAYLNEIGNRWIEDGLYNNYEYIATLLHLAILFSMVRWDVIRSAYRVFRDNILLPFLHQRLILPF